MPEDPLHSWTDWGSPFQSLRLLEKLDAGLTNQNYLIEANERRCVLRINAQNSLALGIDRKREKLILEKASASGLAPDVLFCSPEHGVLITDFIDGQHWHASDLDDANKLSLLTTAINQIHNLNVETEKFDYQKHEQNYWQQLQDKAVSIPDELFSRRDSVLKFIEEIPVTATICHHDLNPANIIVQSDRIYFLDWEYAAPAWPALDFAALSVEWAIPVEQLPLPAHISVKDVLLASELYIHLCDLWSCLQNSKNL
jgi:thiamine kinase